jgi:hypothetical protein
MEISMPHENDPVSQTPEQPKYVTADEIGNIVNSALTARLPKMLTPAIEAALAPITAKLAAAPAPVAATEEQEPAKGKGKQSPELADMARKVEQMEKALASEKERVAAAEKKQREDAAYQTLRTSLEGKVRPELLDMVAKHLFVVEGRVEIDEAGTPLFKSTKVPYTGADPEDVRLPLASGVEDFLKSDAAKPFLPAPNSGAGAGPLPKRGPSPTQSGVDFSKPASSDAEKARRSAERERIANERLGRIK